MSFSSLSPLRGANSAPPNPLVGFERPLGGGEKRGKKNRNERQKKRDGTDGRKHSQK